MSQPSTQSLRERLEKLRDRLQAKSNRLQELEWDVEVWNEYENCAGEVHEIVEALLPTLESALGEWQAQPEPKIRTRIVREILDMDADSESREIELRHCLDALEQDFRRTASAPAATEGDSAREVAEQIVKPYMSAGAFAIDCATQLIELYTQQAVAQARVDLLIEARRVLGTGTDNFRRWLDARKFAGERDLAAIASGKEPVKE